MEKNRVKRMGHLLVGDTIDQFGTVYFEVTGVDNTWITPEEAVSLYYHLGEILYKHGILTTKKD